MVFNDTKVVPARLHFQRETGAVHSVLGIDVEQSIGKFMGDPPRRYEPGKGPCKLEGCVFTIDTETGRCLQAEAVRLT